MGLVSFNTIPNTVNSEIFARVIFSLLVRCFVEIKLSKIGENNSVCY